MSIDRNLISRMEIPLSSEYSRLSDRRLLENELGHAIAGTGPYAPEKKLVTCVVCNGTGEGLDDLNCAICEGAGRIWQ